MSNEPVSGVSRFVEAWSKAAPLLERERRERLRRMTDDECRAAIWRIFAGPIPPFVERATGLVEQQRIFRKLR